MAPRTELERTIAAVWREVLSVPDVGVDDNFFDLGGDSLRIGRIGRRLGEVLGREVPLTDLFEHPTISAIAAHLGAAPAAATANTTDRAGLRGEARRERARRRRHAGASEDPQTA
jgi:acyl carrier protein